MVWGSGCNSVKLNGGSLSRCPARRWRGHLRRAQQSNGVRRVVVVMGLAEDDPEAKARLAGFRQGLEKRGWSDGRDVSIETRFTRDSSADRLQVLARELIALQPDVILAESTPIVAALQRETRTIPIVFSNIADPVGSGFVASLPRPGGNITGLMLFEASVTGKWLAMLKEIAPHLTRVALVAGPKTTAYDYFVRNAEAEGPSLGIEIVPTPVAGAADIERGIEAFWRVPNGGLLLPESQHGLQIIR